MLSAAGAVILVVMFGNSDERSELNVKVDAEVSHNHQSPGNTKVENTNTTQGNGSISPINSRFRMQFLVIKHSSENGVFRSVQRVTDVHGDCAFWSEKASMEIG